MRFETSAILSTAPRSVSGDISVFVYFKSRPAILQALWVKVHFLVLSLSNPCPELWNVCLQIKPENLLSAALQTSPRFLSAPGSCTIYISVNSTAIYKGRLLWWCTKSYLSSTPHTPLPNSSSETGTARLDFTETSALQVYISFCSLERVIIITLNDPVPCSRHV